MVGGGPIESVTGWRIGDESLRGHDAKEAEPLYRTLEDVILPMLHLQPLAYGGDARGDRAQRLVLHRTAHGRAVGRECLPRDTQLIIQRRGGCGATRAGPRVRVAAD
jgi:hypothetical protein